MSVLLRIFILQKECNASPYLRKSSAAPNLASVTVHEASLSIGFPARKWFHWILQGLIPSRPELKEDNIKGISYSSLSHQVLIPASSLPKYYRADLIPYITLGLRISFRIIRKSHRTHYLYDKSPF